MRKQCTASSCRRTFPVKAGSKVSCPYCGKSYPRLMQERPRVVPTDWTLIIDEYEAPKLKLLVAAARVIREQIRRDLSLGEAAHLLRNCPAIVKSGMDYRDAQEALSLLGSAGIGARIAKLTDRETQYFHTV